MIARLRRSVAVDLFAVAALMATWSAGAMAAPADRPQVQGHWTYTQRADDNVIEYMATTPSAQDANIWLLVACGTDARLTVALIHVAGFAFPLPDAAPVRLRAAGLPDLPVMGKSIAAKQVVIDPGVMRRVMPQLIDRDRFAVLLAEQDGTPHEYTFLMQPNDRALAPLRSLCLNSASNA